MADPSDSSKSSQDLPPPDLEPVIQELADRFLRALQAGEQPERAAWEREHPELMPHLGRRLAWIEQIAQRAQQPVHEEEEAGPQADPLPDDGAPGTAPVPLTGGESSWRLKCPQCGHAIQVVMWEEPDVTCRTCGSTFRLAMPDWNRLGPEEMPREIGRFRVESFLGRGTFGVVYRALDPELRRTVAIKVPRLGYFAAEEEQQRFLHEAVSVARLRHPRIVQLYEVGKHGTRPFLVTEFIDGLTLEAIAARRKLSFTEVAVLLAEVADAVDYAHREGVIHRDLKPGNVLIDQQRRPYVTDFGLARCGDPEITITPEGDVIGTPSYMSPEQALAQHALVCPASDVFSLGVMLYRLLSGELPFRGSKEMTLKQVVAMDPRPLRDINDRIPLDLQTITFKALAKEINKRYPTAAELAADLRRWLAREPIKARPTSVWERTLRWCSRNRAIASLLAVIGLLILTFMGVLAVVAVRESRLRQRADTDRDRAERSESATRTVLVQRQLQQATELLDRDPLRAGVPLVAALSVDSAEQAGDHRVRLGDWWRRVPRLEQLWSYQAAATQVVVSPNGRHVAAGGRFGVTVWDLTTLEPTGLALPNLGAVQLLAFSPDGQRLAIAAEGAPLVIRDVPRGTASLPPLGSDLPHVWRLAWSDDGKYLAVARAGGLVQVWDTSSGGLAWERPQPDVARVLTFAPQSTRLFVGLGSNTQQPGLGRLYDVTNGEEVGEPIRHATSLADAHFHPRQPWLVTLTNDGEMGWFDSQTLVSHRAIAPPSGRPLFARFLPDTPVLLLATQEGTLQRWDYESGERREIQAFADGERLSGMTLAADGQRLAAHGSRGTVRVWRTHDLEPVSERLPHGELLRGLALAPDSERLISGTAGGTIRVWRMSPEPGGTPRLASQSRAGVEFFADGRLAASVTDQHALQIWRVSAAGEVEAMGKPLVHPAEVIQFAVDARDANWLVTVCADGQLRRWNRQTGEVRTVAAPALTGAYAGLRRSEAGQLVVWGRGESLLRIDVASATFQTLGGHVGGVIRGAASRDARVVAVLTQPGQVRVWQVAEDGTASSTTLDLPDQVAVLAVRPDGEELVVGDLQGVVSRWRVLPGGARRLGDVRHSSAIVALNYSPTGEQLVVATREGTLLIRDAMSLELATRISDPEAGRFAQVEFAPSGRWLLAAGNWHSPADFPARPNRGFAQVWDAVGGTAVTGKWVDERELFRGAFCPTYRWLAVWGATSQATLVALAEDPRPLNELRDVAELYAAHRLDDRGVLVPLTAVELQTRFDRGRAAKP